MICRIDKFHAVLDISILTTGFKQIYKFPLFSPPLWPYFFFFFKPLQNHKTSWRLKCFMVRRQMWLQMRTHQAPRKPRAPLSSPFKSTAHENIYFLVNVIVYCLWICSINLHYLEKCTVSFFAFSLSPSMFLVISYCRVTQGLLCNKKSNYCSGKANLPLTFKQMIGKVNWKIN